MHFIFSRATEATNLIFAPLEKRDSSIHFRCKKLSQFYSSSWQMHKLDVVNYLS